MVWDSKMMNFNIEGVLSGLVIIVLNVLDSATTNLAFRQYPDKELKGEGNPFIKTPEKTSYFNAGDESGY